jgi:DNA-binding winged helix-turn-helix (wHTH) protein
MSERLNVRFGDFQFDGGSRQLVGPAGVVHLTLKAFALLQLLIERRPAAVSKEDILTHLWPGTFVSEANLPSLIAEIRTALEDRAREPRFIRTVHGFGYSFCGDTEPTEDERPRPVRAIYSLIWESHRLPLFEGENVVGRDLEATVAVDSTGVSRRHCLVTVNGVEVTVADLGSKNGTYVRDERIGAPVRVSSGDRIRIGSLLLILRLDREISTETQSSRAHPRT